MRIPLGLFTLALRIGVKLPLRLVRRPETLRARFEWSGRHVFRVPDGARFAEETLPDGAGGSMRALRAAAGETDPERLILYLHGGAYIAGSPETHRHLAAALAREAGAPAIVPHYRRAPEHAFPAAVEDALAAYRALLARGYPARRIALAGDSAGGGLAAALLVRLARAELPHPACACLFSPWADMTATAPSLERNARRDPMLPVSRMAEVIGHYLQGADPSDPLASPARARFDSPPPALILAGRHEILADDATMLADSLRVGGGDVELELWARVPHAWPIFLGLIAEADRTVAHAGAFIGRHLGTR
jgi:acetyl esterase/lipase